MYDVSNISDDSQASTMMGPKAEIKWSHNSEEVFKSMMKASRSVMEGHNSVMKGQNH